MEQLLFSLNATIPVFLVMVIGYVLQQLHVTNDSFVKTLNSFNYKITLPVLLFKDMSTADFYSVWDTGYVLFCFFVTLFCIVITWVVAGIFYKNKSRLGELVQASYRSSAAVLGIAFIQNIYGNSGMAPLMIVGTVPLYNIAAVLILSFTGPDAKGFDKESDHYQYRPGYVVQRLPDQLSRDHLEDHQQYRRVGNPIGPDRPRCRIRG